MRIHASFRTKKRSPYCTARRGMVNEQRVSMIVVGRQGFSLIEVLVVITMLTAVMSLTGMTFYLLMRSEKMVSQSFVTERGISRLAVQFRDDVHQSESGTVIDKTANSRNELALGDASGVRVRYRVTRHGLTRLVIENDAIVGRDDFHLPECTVRLVAGSESDSSLRTLVIERPGAAITQNPQAPSPLRALKIEAYLNRRQPVIPEVASAGTDDNSTSRSEKEERK